MNFNPKEGVQGLGYRGLDPGLALQARGGSEHIDLFDPQSHGRSVLFGDAGRGPRRGGVAGEVGLLQGGGWMIGSGGDSTCPAGVWAGRSGGRRRRRRLPQRLHVQI